MRRLQLLQRVEELLRRPRYRIMVAALRLNLDQERDVTEEDERVRKLRPFLLAPRVAVHEVTKERLLKEPLRPPLLVVARLPTDFRRARVIPYRSNGDPP